MGHRHFPTQFKLDDETSYTNLGEWVNYTYYAVFDGVELKLLDWKST